MARTYKTIKGVSTAVARCVVQDLAYASGRWVYSGKQFTMEDKEKIRNIAMCIEGLLIRADGRYWGDVLSDIERMCSMDFHLGFHAQDMILDTCRRCGIRILPESLRRRNHHESVSSLEG